MRAQGIPDSPARVEFTMQFSHGRRGQRRAREASEQPGLPSKGVSAANVPKITRLLVLGHHFERLVSEGKVKDYAEIARLTGLTRARVTQIVNLTLLAPEIQERILALSSLSPGTDPLTEPALREVSAQVHWHTQKRFWLKPRH